MIARGRLAQHLEAYRDYPEIQELMEAMQGIGKDPAAAQQNLQDAARRLRARGEISGAERIEEAARLLPQIAAGLMASGTTPADLQPIGGATTADRHPIGGILLGLGFGIVPAVLLCWAAIYSMYGRTLTCERFGGRRVDCSVTAGFLGREHPIAFVPAATARIELEEHARRTDTYEISLAPAAGSLRADDHFEFSEAVVPHVVPDAVDRLKSFFADREQRSLALVLKRPDRFDLREVGCFGGLAAFLLLLGVGFIRQAIARSPATRLRPGNPT